MYKSKLQELCHKRSWNLLEYVTQRVGPDHNPRFSSRATINGVCFETPQNQCRSSKEAHNMVAQLAFEHLINTMPPVKEANLWSIASGASSSRTNTNVNPEQLALHPNQETPFGWKVDTGPKVLRAKAANSEQKEELKHKLNPARMSAFDEMLYNVYATRCPKPSDYDVRKDLVRVFNEIAKELYGDSNVPAVVVFGSFSMDIFDAKSDLDLSVNFGNGSVELPREKKIQTLRKFAKKLYALQKSGHVTGVLPVIRAKVPILKVVDCRTDVECDISIENWDGILKSQIINMISTIDDRFPKLSFLMKAWAKAHNINSSKDKTMNSLSIVQLAAFHMQTRNPPILPPFSALLKDGSDAKSVKILCRNFAGYGRNNKETLAELFFSLLVKLSAVEILWPKGLCASAYEGSWVCKTWDSKVSCISIEDFTDLSQNVARAVGVSQVKTIYKCIQLSVRHLSAFMDGQIEGSRLIELLFGSSTAPAIVGTGIPHTAGVASGRGKKRRPILANSVMEKRSRPIDSLGGTSIGSWIIPPPVVNQWTRTHPPTGNWIRPLAVVEAQTWTHPTTASWIRPPVGAEHQTSTHIAGCWGQPPIGIKQHQPITGWRIPHQSPPGAWDGRVFPSVPTWETQIAWNRSADVPVEAQTWTHPTTASWIRPPVGAEHQTRASSSRTNTNVNPEQLALHPNQETLFGWKEDTGPKVKMNAVQL